MMQRQFFKFLVIGVLSTLVNYLCFFILFKYYLIYYLVASALGFIAGVFVGYSLNKTWTFQVSKSSELYLHKYFAVYCISLLLSILILKFMVSTLLFVPELANFVAIGVTTCTNFLGVKFLVFKR